MLYEAELFYFRKQPRLSLPDVLRLSAQHAGTYATWYRAVVTQPFKEDLERNRRHQTPIKRMTKRLTREGELPKNEEERKRYIDGVLDWIFDLAPWWTSFEVYLATSPISSIPQPLDTTLFYSEWHVWQLNIFPHQFEELVRDLVSHGFPADIFYPETATICAPWQPTSTFGKMIRKLGFTFQRCYSPKEWEERQNKRE